MDEIKFSYGVGAKSNCSAQLKKIDIHYLSVKVKQKYFTTNI